MTNGGWRKRPAPLRHMEGTNGMPKRPKLGLRSELGKNAEQKEKVRFK